MKLRTLTSRHRIEADLAAFAGGQPFLVIEVKAMHGVAADAAEWLSRLLSRLKEYSGLEIPFGMVVDLDDILVLDLKKDDPTVPVCRLETTKILEAFDPEFAHKRIFDEYLLGLVEAWLQGFGWRRSLASPPGMKQFAEVGLAELLIESSICRQVHLADADSVS